MTIRNSFIKWREDDFYPYSDIQISEWDYKIISSFFWNSDIFDKLHKITEYKLAMQVVKWKISKESFDWAMEYSKYLREYFKPE